MSFTATFPVGLPVNWHGPDDILIDDAQLKNWLLDTGSLTERVQASCQHFALQLLGQQTQVPHPSEQSMLSANGDTRYQAREILLCGDGTPWVFARSIIPQAFVDAELSELGNEPLGKRLFNDVRFKRSEFQLCQLSASAFGYDTSHTLWGRRSLFTLDNYSMIVAEVFLPEAPAYCAMKNAKAS